jgi:Protein of unknown function (DUF2442)
MEINVLNAEYIESYKLEIFFSNDKKKLVDFAAFLETHSHPQNNKYKKENNFKKFKIENGNVVWGKDWDMIFPVDDLYKGKLN